MIRVTSYNKYEGASVKDFTSLEDAKAYFEEVKAGLWSDDTYKVEIGEYTAIAASKAE